MKSGYYALGAALSCLLLASSAPAQNLRQPLSVRPAAMTNDFDYYYYADEPEQPSPSDAAAPAEPTPAEPAPVAASGGGCASISDCDGCGGVACDGCDGCGACGSCSCFLFGPREPWTLFANDNSWGLKAGFWTQLGYTSQSTGLFNDLPDRVNLQQQWFWLEKEADGKSGWDWGFRFDMMYGTDGTDTQAFGNNAGRWDYLNGFDFGVYSWALPQAYLEVANGDLSIKAGHFFTLVGYEVVAAPDNFFYSHSFTLYNSEPFTHTGVIASYGMTDNLEVHAGWTAGWDTGFDQYMDGSSFLGGFSYSLTDNVKFTYITTVGNFGWRGDGYSHSAVLDVDVTDRLKYVLQSDLVATDGVYTVDDRFLPGVFNDSVGINQYLLYSLNDCWAVGARAEWWKNDGVSVDEVTVGLNWKPAANIVVRPEVREQWVPALDLDEFIVGIDTVITY